MPARVEGDFNVIRHVILFEDPMSTDKVTGVLRAALPPCVLFNGTQTSDWSADEARCFDISGSQTVLSQTRTSRKDGGVHTVIDIVSTESNAVVWMHIGSDITVKKPAILMAKVPANADWYDEVRRQDDSGLELLQSLKSAGR